MSVSPALAVLTTRTYSNSWTEICVQTEVSHSMNCQGSVGKDEDRVAGGGCHRIFPSLIRQARNKD